MSYHSVHMGYPIKGGYRRSQLQRITVAALSNMTWRELRMPDPYLNGNTKWQEMPIVAFYFKHGFVNKSTAVDIGYYTSKTNSTAVCKSLVYRLNRVNTQSLLSFGTKMMMSGLLKRDWAWVLDPERRKRHTNGGGGGPLSNLRITFSKAICEQAVEKYGYTKVSMKLRVDMKVIAFWLNYDN